MSLHSEWKVAAGSSLEQVTKTIKSRQGNNFSNLGRNFIITGIQISNLSGNGYFTWRGPERIGKI
jgi:hypothetical protein